MFDLGAYLDPIELRGSPTLGAVHRAHATSIPFQNLGTWSEQPVSLDQGDIERKLVGERQGCWREPGLGDGQVRFVRARI
jgi:N-hydroxyarylamine O-acetyltransferase